MNNATLTFSHSQFLPHRRGTSGYFHTLGGSPTVPATPPYVSPTSNNTACTPSRASPSANTSPLSRRLFVTFAGNALRHVYTISPRCGTALSFPSQIHKDGSRLSRLPGATASASYSRGREMKRARSVVTNRRKRNPVCFHC